MRKFKVKPAKAVKNKDFIMKQWRVLAPVVIASLHTPQEASKLESDLYNARTCGLITDSEYNQYVEKIKEICKENNWAMP